jgi:DDE superfamily endonuclease
MFEKMLAFLQKKMCDFGRPLKSKLHPLTKEQKTSNPKLSHECILVENVIRKLKSFRILSE